MLSDYIYIYINKSKFSFVSCTLNLNLLGMDPVCFFLLKCKKKQTGSIPFYFSFLSQIPSSFLTEEFFFFFYKMSLNTIIKAHVILFKALLSNKYDLFNVKEFSLTFLKPGYPQFRIH